MSASHFLLLYHRLDCIELAAGTVPVGATHITVAPLDFLPDAVTVEVEPLTSSDWESLEVYAEFLEEGGLLQQVSIVYPNQILSLRVDSEIVNVQVHADCPCRLLADTEVHIRPKPRTSGCKQSPLLRVVPAWEDFTPAMQKLATQTDGNYTPIHVTPCTVLVHPKTLEQCGFDNGSIVVIQKERSQGSTQGTAVARVQASELVAEDSVGE